MDSSAGANDTAPDNGQVAFNYFVSQGYAPHQAAGIVGNLQGESGQGLNPSAVNRGDGSDGSDSIGIGQWNGTRAQALKNYAASKGAPVSDIGTQLEFLHSELKGPESAAYGRLMAAKTPEEAGQAMLAYERPKDWNQPGAHPERANYAAKAYAAYGGGAQARPTTGILNQPAPSPSSGPGLLNGASPEPDDTAALQLAFAKASQQPQEQQVAPLPPIQYAVPKHIDRAKLVAALTRRVA